jgi:hypothetical protein
MEVIIDPETGAPEWKATDWKSLEKRTGYMPLP